MRVWLITVGEPLPTDAGRERLFRTGILASTLVARGHEVVWWTSTFDHARKRQRFHTDTTLDVNDRLRIILLHSVAYRKNVSVVRVINHCGVARKFSRLAESEVRPDIILSSMPTVELSLAATEYGGKKGVPVVLDVRDLWPDIFVEVVPAWARGVFQWLLTPMFKSARNACANATAITGITPAFVDWGVNYALRKRTPWDRDFPLAYTSTLPSPHAILGAERFWERHGVTKDGQEFVACFFGALGEQSELETVIDAARELNSRGGRFRFVFCGTGDRLGFYKKRAHGCGSVVFPGWVGAVEIWSLMRMSAVGLAPYRNSPSFMASIPNKAIEYLSAGLPIISSLNGTLKDLLSAHDCGVVYESGNAAHLASVLHDLSRAPDRRKALSDNASKLYQARFVAETTYREMSGYLEGLAAVGRARRA